MDNLPPTAQWLQNAFNDLATRMDRCERALVLMWDEGKNERELADIIAELDNPHEANNNNG